ncbi:MAG: hypothetical protein ACO1RX_02950 [Candidatus Sericytochromatia bacterium]
MFKLKFLFFLLITHFLIVSACQAPSTLHPLPAALEISMPIEANAKAQLEAQGFTDIEITLHSKLVAASQGNDFQIQSKLPRHLIENQWRGGGPIPYEKYFDSWNFATGDIGGFAGSVDEKDLYTYGYIRRWTQYEHLDRNFHKAYVTLSGAINGYYLAPPTCQPFFDIYFNEVKVATYKPNFVRKSHSFWPEKNAPLYEYPFRHISVKWRSEPRYLFAQTKKYYDEKNIEKSRSSQSPFYIVTRGLAYCKGELQPQQLEENFLENFTAHHYMFTNEYKEEILPSKNLALSGSAHSTFVCPEEWLFTLQQAYKEVLFIYDQLKRYEEPNDVLILNNSYLRYFKIQHFQPSTGLTWHPYFRDHVNIAPQTFKVASSYPSEDPSSYPSEDPSSYPSEDPSSYPSEDPSSYPSEDPSSYPSEDPSSYPSEDPSSYPSEDPSSYPSEDPSPGPRRGGNSDNDSDSYSLPELEDISLGGMDGGIGSSSLGGKTLGVNLVKYAEVIEAFKDIERNGLQGEIQVFKYLIEVREKKLEALPENDLNQEIREQLKHEIEAIEQLRERLFQVGDKTEYIVQNAISYYSDLTREHHSRRNINAKSCEPLLTQKYNELELPPAKLNVLYTSWGADGNILIYGELSNLENIQLFDLSSIEADFQGDLEILEKPEFILNQFNGNYYPDQELVDRVPFILQIPAGTYAITDQYRAKLDAARQAYDAAGDPDAPFSTPDIQVQLTAPGFQTQAIGDLNSEVAHVFQMAEYMTALSAFIKGTVLQELSKEWVNKSFHYLIGETINYDGMPLLNKLDANNLADRIHFVSMVNKMNTQTSIGNFQNILYAKQNSVRYSKSSVLLQGTIAEYFTERHLPKFLQTKLGHLGDYKTTPLVSEAKINIERTSNEPEQIDGLIYQIVKAPNYQLHLPAEVRVLGFAEVKSYNFFEKIIRQIANKKSAILSAYNNKNRIYISDLHTEAIITSIAGYDINRNIFNDNFGCFVIRSVLSPQNQLDTNALAEKIDSDIATALTQQKCLHYILPEPTEVITQSTMASLGNYARKNHRNYREIYFSDYYSQRFDPSDIKVTEGTKVRWINQSVQNFHLRSLSRPELFSTQELAPGIPFSYFDFVFKSSAAKKFIFEGTYDKDIGLTSEFKIKVYSEKEINDTFQ